MSISPQNALKLSAWIALHQPDFFRVLLVQTQKLQRSPLGRLGFFGDDGDISDGADVSTDMPEVDVSAEAPTPVDVSPNVTLSDVSIGDVGVSDSANQAITQAVAAPPALDNSTADASQSGSSFWGSVAQGASSVAGAVGKVASALVSPATLAAAGTAAAAYFNSQAKTAQAAQQQALLNAQLARVGAGAAPAPLTYQLNPATGQMVPVYASNSGYQPVTGSLLNRLSAPGTAGLSGLSTPVLLIGGAVLVISILLASRGSS